MGNAAPPALKMKEPRTKECTWPPDTGKGRKNRKGKGRRKGTKEKGGSPLEPPKDTRAPCRQPDFCPGPHTQTSCHESDMPLNSGVGGTLQQQEETRTHTTICRPSAMKRCFLFQPQVPPLLPYPAPEPSWAASPSHSTHPSAQNACPISSSSQFLLGGVRDMPPHNMPLRYIIFE